MSEPSQRFSWLAVLLALAILTLVIQLFPAVFRGVISALDVRAWSWRSYAVASAAAIVILVGIKATRNR
jgi:hypothetical protein